MYKSRVVLDGLLGRMSFIVFLSFSFVLLVMILVTSFAHQAQPFKRVGKRTLEKNEHRSLRSAGDLSNYNGQTSFRAPDLDVQVKPPVQLVLFSVALVLDSNAVEIS